MRLRTAGVAAALLVMTACTNRGSRRNDRTHHHGGHNECAYDQFAYDH